MKQTLFSLGCLPLACALQLFGQTCTPPNTTVAPATGNVSVSPSASVVQPNDPWTPLGFLEGTWAANATGSGAAALGNYTWARELHGHVLARHGTNVSCHGPDDFDCNHRDLLYVYQDVPGGPLRAIYFDNEGHTIHYEVTAPAPDSVVFLSDPTARGPQFRLVYQLQNGQMHGSFAVRPPGTDAWHPYLEWSGVRQ